MFSIEEWQDLSDYGVQSLTDLSLFVHFNIQTVRHLVVLNILDMEKGDTQFSSTHHYIVSLHLSFFLSKFLTFKFQSRKARLLTGIHINTEDLRMVLVLNKVELLFDPFTGLRDVSHFERSPWSPLQRRKYLLVLYCRIT